MNKIPQNLSPQDVKRLLNIAGKKLGTDPKTLKNQIENGSFTNDLNEMQKKQVGELLSDRDKLNQFLQSGPVQQMLNQLLTKGK